MAARDENRRWRTFLEKPSNGVDSYVAVSRGRNWAELKLADCNDTISLWFEGLQSGKQRETARKKLARLRRALDLVDRAITEAEVRAELKGDDDDD